jgi:hypothetical protein
MKASESLNLSGYLATAGWMDGWEILQVWRVEEGIWNKQSRTANKKWGLMED